MIYFDSSATTLQKPPSVAEAVARAIRTHASVGRGGHPAAERAAQTVFACRSLAGQLFDASPEQVVFTMNATHGLNLAIKTLVKPGDRVIVSGFEHNAVLRPLHAVGAELTVVGAALFRPDRLLEELAQALAHRPAAVVCTHVSNVFGYILPLADIAALCRMHGVPLIVDNTFATPYLFRPLEHGADVVVESATKFIGGHGTVLGGAIIEGDGFNWGNGKFPGLSEPDPSYHGISFWKALGNVSFVTRIRAILLRDTGATISPVTAFVLLQGLETLSLRVDRHVENALKVVDYLKSHPKVRSVSHPSLPDHPSHALYEKYFPDGAGSIFTFEIDGDEETAKKFIDNLKLFSLLANVADVKSLVIHPKSTTHSQLTEEEFKEQGITPSTIRLSIGTEHIDDIIADLEQAFSKI